MPKRNRLNRKTKTLSPRRATTLSKIVALRNDTLCGKTHWLYLGVKHIVIVEQSSDQAEPQQIMKVPRQFFNRMVDFYSREQALIP